MKRILIFEYASSGIANASSILTEGFAMLNFAIEEARKADFEAVTLLDPRIARLDLIEDIEVLPYSEDLESFKAALKEVDAALIIAPETDLLLYKLAKMVEKAKIPLLGCTSTGIKAATDKAKTNMLLRKARINVPESQKVAFKYTEKKLKGIKYPAVFKPLDGVGSAGISIVKEEEEVNAAISKVRSETNLEHFLAEDYIEGKHASAGVLCTSNGTAPVTLNAQKIMFGESGLRYMGNSTPLHHDLEQEAKQAAEKAVLSIRGLRGYAGVDMVLTQEKAYVIEINPRLTTSCLIAGKVAGINIVRAICDAGLEQKLPPKIWEKGFAAIERVTSPGKMFVSEELAMAIWRIEGVASPPLAINEHINKGETLAFISKYGESESSVSGAMASIKQKIYKLLESGKC